MVKQGEADMCVGDFWETFERRALVSFSSPFADDYLQLVTTGIASDQFTWARTWKVFSPFSPAVWVTTFAWCLLAALFIFIAEHPEMLGEHGELQTEDFSQQLGDDVFITLSRPLAGIWRCMCRSVVHCGRRLHLVLTLCVAALRSAQLAVMGLLMRTGLHAPVRVGGQITFMGFALMLYWTAACHMAATINWYRPAKPDLDPRVASLAELSRTKGKLCALEALVDDIAPKGIRNIKGLDSYGPVLEHLFLGNCDAALVGRTDIYKYIRGENGQFNVCSDPEDPGGYSWCTKLGLSPVRIHLDCRCPDWAHLGDEKTRCPDTCPTAKRYCGLLPLTGRELAVPFALPVRSDLRDYISAWITKFAEDNVFGSLRAKYVWENPEFSDKCSVDIRFQDKEPVRVSAVAGLAIISASIMVLGGLVATAQRIRQIMQARMRESSLRSLKNSRWMKDILALSKQEDAEKEGPGVNGEVVTASLMFANGRTSSSNGRTSSVNGRPSSSSQVLKITDGAPCQSSILCGPLRASAAFCAH